MADTIFTLTEQLQKIATEGVELARRTSSDTDLTPEGRTRRFTNWGRDKQWGTRIDQVEQRANRAFDKAAKAADDARARVIGKPSTAEATLAELRFARRADSIRAALADRNSYPDMIRDLIAKAEPADMPLLVEEIGSFYSQQPAGSHFGTSGLESLEQALRGRDPEYATAADLAERVERERGTVARLVEGARLATSDLEARESKMFALMNRDPEDPAVRDMPA